MKKSANSLKNNKKGNIVIFIFGIILILLDQIIKLLIIHKDINIIPGFLRFTYIENKGVAFGMLSSNQNLVIILNSIFLLMVSIYFFKKDDILKKEKIALILILSGGLSNLFDRIFRGFIIDYMNIYLLDFPIFNLADVFLTVGVIIMLIYLTKRLLKNN